MKFAFALVLAAAGALSSSAVLAQQQPSEASVEELLRLVRAETMTDQINQQIEPMMASMLAGMSRQQKLTTAQQSALDSVPARLATVLRDEYRWDKMKPEYVALYREVYSQDEVDGQIAFYRTPIGQAVVAKQPVLAEKAMALSAAQMQAMMPRIQAAMRQAVQDAKAASAEPAAGADRPAPAKATAR